MSTTCTPSRPLLRPSLPRRLPAAMVATLTATVVLTGLAAPVRAARGRPVLESRAQALAEGTARPGLTRALDTGLPTELVGFDWKGRTAGAIEVRAKRGGAWGPWLRAEGEPTEGPDPGSREFRGRTFAGPVWVGKGVRQVEVRVAEGRLDGVKVHAIRSEDPPASGGIAPAGAGVPQPAITGRAAWGADESFRSIAPGCNGRPEYADRVRFAVVHHTATSNDYGPGDGAALVRGIYYFHTHTNQWCDIGYNFLVDKFGQVFEGRAGGIAAPVVGAHALGFNTGSTGVALIGTYQTDPVPGVMYSALRTLLAWKLGFHGVDPTAQISVNGKTIATVVGHRDVNATECPGDLPYQLLPQLRSELGGLVPRNRITSVNSGEAVDVYGASTADGARVIQWPANGGRNQQWILSPLGGDVVKITSVNSGKVLDVYGASTADGAAVIQWPWNGGDNQRWHLVSIGTNLYQLVSVKSGKLLDVSGASVADGAPLIQWPSNGGRNQQWQLF